MKSLATVSTLLCLCGCFGTACQACPVSPTKVPPPTTAPTSLFAGTPPPAPGPLTDAQAMAMVETELTTRGIASDTLRIKIAGQPRWASIRYTSSHALDSPIFQPQTVLVALATARVMARVHPPVSGGVRLAAIPSGEGIAGLRAIIISGSFLKAWANGSMSDQEFVSQWTVGTVTKE